MRGVVVWITGLPSSGKSTLAMATARELRAAGYAPILLDGDVIRAALVPAPGYDEADRDAFYETLARLAGLIAEQSTIVLVAATAHRRRYRERARALAPDFLEVFVDTPASVCRERDPKGLYRAGTPGLPGAALTYEPPETPAMTVRSGDVDAAHRLAELLEELTAN